MKTIPKSLHTVTSLAHLAEWIALNKGATLGRHHVYAAAMILGYKDAPDEHGLIEAACKKLRLSS